MSEHRNAYLRRRAAIIRCACQYNSTLPPMPYQPPVVMTIAASDPSGGAGIQADILTLASMGVIPFRY